MTAHTTPKTAPKTAHDALADGRQVLATEITALQQLDAQLNGSFIEAINVLALCKGRVVVTGIGKSGHVARKISATFASTGTPAMFVHPAEASHGDLGMVTKDDVVLALSNSGEAGELGDIVAYAKRFSIPLIAMTASPESTLAQQADVILWVGPSPEACPNQQAPTTSTTLMIALGDAIAVALMKRRGFSATDFRQYHPGGKLGGQLLAVQTIMQQGDLLPLVSNTATMAETQTIMSDKNFGCAIIVDDKKELAGFITDGDIRRHLSPDLLQKKVTDIMGTKTPRTIAHDALAAAALAAMNQYNITQLVVTEGQTPVGLIRLHDIMRAGVA